MSLLGLSWGCEATDADGWTTAPSRFRLVCSHRCVCASTRFHARDLVAWSTLAACYRSRCCPDIMIGFSSQKSRRILFVQIPSNWKLLAAAAVAVVHVCARVSCLAHLWWYRNQGTDIDWHRRSLLLASRTVLRPSIPTSPSLPPLRVLGLNDNSRTARRGLPSPTTAPTS